MRRHAAVLALSLISLAGVACKAEEGAKVASSEGEQAPAFETRDLAGEGVALADLEGKVVLLNVWATWCKPCVAELPVLADLHRDLEPKGFTVVGLNADVRTKLPAVRSMVAEQSLPFPIWLDAGGQAQTTFKLNGYPTSFLIDRHGRIRWKREGVILRNDPELAAMLEAVLAEG
nr:TlpA disulfide reductase family protein [Pseudenhygromyxa sp. WMMC2535]